MMVASSRSLDLLSSALKSKGLRYHERPVACRLEQALCCGSEFKSLSKRAFGAVSSGSRLLLQEPTESWGGGSEFSMVRILKVSRTLPRHKEPTQSP